MRPFWEFFENMNEIVYASDIDTCEIIYMNKKARDLYAIASAEELKGKKCYEVLQTGDFPCTICNSSTLKPDSFDERSYYHPVLKKSFLLKDTLIKKDGHRYRVEIAIDTAPPEQNSTLPNTPIDNESIVSSSMRIAMSVVDPDRSIQLMLDYLGRALQCDRIYIFEESLPTKVWNNTYEWCASNVRSEKANLQNIPSEDTRIWMEHFQINKNVIIHNLEDIKQIDPVMYAYLFPQNIHSLIVSPLFVYDKVAGFYGVDNPPESSIKSISSLLQIMGYFIVSLLKRRALYRKLEQMSYCDHLTGMGNRRAMEKFVSEVNSENSMGVIYCDVMGLKRTNDTLGHQAGDALLVRACDALKQVFSKDSLFRVGGDEFLVLCANISENALNEKVAQLKAAMQQHNVLMALGCVWRRNAINDMDELFSLADARMYEDKRRYYAQSNGLRERRSN